MEKIGIIGAGISGLTLASLLNKTHEVVVFEKEEGPGGLIRCKKLPEGLFHICGGHVFNTKVEEVQNWFWHHFDKENDFVKARRNSVVFTSEGLVIPYPVENHFFLFDKSIQNKIIQDLLFISAHPKEPSNFEDFLINKFGRTLYEVYFEPYNKKVWRRNLSKVPLDWLEGKLPMPTIEEIFYNNINHVEEQSFVHSSFYYEKYGGSQFLIDKLQGGLDIRCKKHVEKLFYQRNQWVIEGEPFDKIVFCGNIKELPTLIRGHFKDLDYYEKEIELLEYHGTTSVFCEIAPNPYSWVYLPNNAYEAHRIICTGNFSRNNNFNGKMTGTVEFTDYYSEEMINNNLKKMPLSPRYIDSHFNEYSYPIQNHDTRVMIRHLKEKLASKNLFITGRFADWEYYNMDMAIYAAMKLVKWMSDK
jgi:protoporphyrinogen oxidase